MTEPLNIHVVALTPDGRATKTTLAKALGDIEADQIAKAKARRCTNCGKYQKIEDLKHLANDDGTVAKICPDCLADDPAAKALYKQQWTQALDTIDAIMSRSDHWYKDAGQLTKGEAFSRIESANANAMTFFRAMAVPPRRKPADRVASLVKAEQIRQRTDRIKKKKAKIKKQSAAARAQADLSKAKLDAALAEYEELAKHAATFTAKAQAQIDQMLKRLEIGRQAPAIATRAKQDREQAYWRERAASTKDPLLKAGYELRANGEDWESDN